MKEKSSRREFIERSIRIAGFVGIGGAATLLARRAAGNAVFQVDPSRCIGCDLCRTSCVLNHSAVKVVNTFSQCGYCQLCPAYFDVTSQPDEKGHPTGKTCPQDAIKRRIVGKVDEDDPNNNYYEYSIDEALCDGCGKCVKACKPPAGNGSLHLEIRYNRCDECDSCAIQKVCPENAIVRLQAPGLSPKGAHTEAKPTT
jgi:Na+-translocating ferredoxin:NAD+ oxidoreductase subunit B